MSTGCILYVCSGSVVVTAYDFESDHPGSNPEWGLIIGLRSLHRAYPSVHPFGPVVVHWIPDQLNIKAVTGHAS